MHENREISIAPADSAGRPAKAQSHKAGMYAMEESDRGEEPMNQPNKRVQAPAEAGEGRPRPKENTGQSHTPPAQNGERVSQGLNGVRRAARERKQERFTTLLHHLNVELRKDSDYALQRKAAPGVDGMRWREYEDGREELRQPLLKLLQKPLGVRPMLEARHEIVGIPDKLEVHPDKTRLIAFGREAWQNRKRAGQGKLETFTFLGFTHYCGENSKGYFQVWRETAGKRMRAKLQQIKQELRARMHEPIEATGKWLKRVVLGYFPYHAVPGNLQQMGRFRWRLARLWRYVLRRRSQKSRVTWKQIGPVLDRWIPAPRTLHPYPNVRFDARIQGRSRMR